MYMRTNFILPRTKSVDNLRNYYKNTKKILYILVYLIINL